MLPTSLVRALLIPLSIRQNWFWGCEVIFSDNGVLKVSGIDSEPLLATTLSADPLFEILKY